MNINTPRFHGMPSADIERLVKQAQARGLGRTDQRQTIPVADRSGPLPVSFSQRGLWLLSQNQKASAVYHIVGALRIAGALDRAALRRSMDALMARHEALRTVFFAVDGEPQARLLPATTPMPVAEHDLRGRGDARAILERLNEQEASAPFDLATGPLIRCCLVRMEEDEHVLLLTQHHIVFDGWSAGIFARELHALYGAYAQGRDNPLPALPIQFADYAAWQRSWLSGERLERHSHYWREALKDAPALLDLPTDRPRPAQQHFGGAQVALQLDAELTQALKSLSQKHGSTLFITLLAGWSLVLAKLAGQDDVVIGIPAANRARPETQGLIGFFVNTLAVRVKLAGAGDVGQLLTRVRDVMAGAQEHSELPFHQVTELLQLRRTNHAPVFQALCNWDDLPALPPPADGITVAPVPVSYDVARHDIKLNLSERDGAIHATLLYASALFDAATMQRHAGYLVQVLRAMAADSRQAVAGIDPMPPDERRLLLQQWHSGAVPFPQQRCVHQIFEEQVRRTPEAAALEHDDGTLGYAELNARANRLAHALIGRGVAPGQLVALCVERGAAMVIGMLAILKTGAAYVPLDPAYASERLAQVLADAAPVMVLHDAGGRAALGAAALAERRCLDLGAPDGAADAAGWSSLPADNPEVPQQSSSQLAYVIYTSGSTGTPKGVMVEHRSLVNFLQAMRRHIYRGGQPLRIGWNASFSFDMSMKGFLQLLAGHTLVVIPQPVRASADDFVTFLERRAIDGFDVTPSQLRSLLAHGLLAHARPRTVLIGGEAIDAALWAQLAGAASIEFHNMYGPTECTVDATMGVVGRDDTAPHIGRALDNMRIYLLDPAGRPVPLGAAGEIHIGGVGVARGYLNQPELTGERFLPDPFAGEPGARMYRTGDLARYLADGRLLYLGRNDHQVKLRGFRVELGEIEARLAALDGVRAAAVEARAGADGAERLLVAYVVPRRGDVDTAALIAALRDALAAQLPDYMVPGAFVRLDALPLTPNGKLDRKALPAPDGAAFALNAYEAPQDGLEQTMAGLWQDLLQTPRVGRRDDFFALGGHSLLAVRLMVHIRQALGVELPVVTLFSHPTLAGLSQAVREAGGCGATAERAPIPAVPRGGALPLSFAQQRLWFLAQLDGVSASYHIPTALRLRGALDRAALLRSLDALMARHESLRSVFDLVDGEPRVQLLPAGTALPVLEHDLEGSDDAGRRAARISREEAAAPFDLRHGPLVRARLLRLAPDHHVLLLTLHHIISDGWSNGVIARELGALYHGYAQGTPPALPALAVQYADYAAWQREWLGGERLARQSAYWRDALAGAPALLELPTDRPRPAQLEFAGAQVPVEFDPDLTQAVKRLSQQHGVTVFMTVLAAWGVVLSRLSGQNEVVVGSPTANRGHPQTENLIGFFVNTLALRLNLEGAPGTAELLQRVRSMSLAAQDHQDLPFEQVVELVQPKRRLDHTPVFQVLFNWHNNEASLPAFSGLQVDLLDPGYQAVKFDLELSLGEADGRIAGVLWYATALYDAATMQRHAGYLETVLRAMVAEEQRPLAAVPLLSAHDRERLQAWNATGAAYRQDCCVHHLFEEQARRTPAAPAVRFQGQSVSYSELNAQANRLAHHLIGLGVRPGDRVAICVERSAAMLAGVLAIVKAGGAYVPLDPAYPSERLGQVLDDAAPAAVLSDSYGRRALGAAATGARAMVDLDALHAGDAGAAAWAHCAADDPHPAGLTPDQLAYVIYTSGSTGKPKGVMGLHKPVINLIEWVNRRFAVGPDDVVLLTSSLAFDLSVYDIFGLLAAGGCVHVASRDEVADPQRLADMLFTEKLTFWDSAPAVFQQTLHYLEQAAKLGQPQSQLRLAFFSGDWIPLEFFGAIRRAFPACEMIGLGGATEAAVWSNYFPVTHLDPAWASIPYGRPIQNARYYVLDAHLNALPVGCRGDLYIGGDCVTAGYWGRDELTAERFLPDPFAPGERMYKTGDQARYYQDGNLEFLGRTDFQVKIRGFRIELGEVEARLAESPLVRDSVVVARAGASGEKSLLAYVVPAGAELGAAELAGALRAFMAARLPDYMVPAAFVRLDAMPLTPNGKLDRDLLPAPGGEAFAQRCHTPPEGEVERTLARVWEELLGIERVGRDDNFFELGGHSLLAVRLAERLRQENLGMEVRALFVAPLLRDLALAIEELEEIRL